jgi:hypothetical protein
MSYLIERRYPRLNFAQTSWVFSLRLPEPAKPDKPLRLEAKNISRGGMKFVCNRRFQLFEYLHVSFFEKGTGKSFPTVQGKVVRVEEIDTGRGERTYGIALEFVSGTEDLATFLPNSPAAPSSSSPEK